MGSETQRYVEVDGIHLPSRLLDGYQVHRAALARGLQVLALPRQVLLAGEETAVPAQVSFTHGVPGSSVLSAVTFAQDQRLRRALLERARVPKPNGATFSWRSIGNAQRWAKANGYPVVVKEGVGENPPQTIRNVDSSVELQKAFNDLRRRDVADRTPGNNPRIAGYATTRLTFTYDDEGNEVAPLRSRMLIEQHVPGRHLRAFIIGGQMIAAVELDGDHKVGIRDVTEDLPAKSIGLLVKAAQSIPGLACATVDAGDNAKEGVVGSFSNLIVTGISERPRMETYVTASPTLDTKIGDSLLEFQAVVAGVGLGPVLEMIDRRVEIEGLRYPTDVAQQLPSIVATFGVRMEVGEVDSTAGTIRTWVSGSPGAIAALVELLMAGYLLEDRAAAVNYSKEPKHA